MQTIRMRAAELQRYLQNMIGRRLKDVPPITLPPPIPVEEDTERNWTIDLTNVDMHGHQDMVAALVDDARVAVELKRD